MMKTPPPFIVATCQQTRFHLVDVPASREIDIKDLNVTVTDSALNDRLKTRGKAKADGVEILSHTELRLKAGIHYGLVGRNGTGKSTVLRAIAEKLIPGIPWNMRISILQQSAVEAQSQTEELISCEEDSPNYLRTAKTALQLVVQSDTLRNDVLRECNALSKSFDDSENLTGPVQTMRRLQHERLQRQFFEVEKTARLKSGSRGLEARKALNTFEKKISESARLVNQAPDEIDNLAIQTETRTAVELLTELQSQVELMEAENIENKARTILIGLGFKKDLMDKPFASLSGGWRMRCLLASTLVQRADIIILDEPTNFLDLLGIIWLQRYLVNLRSTSSTTVLLVSHDRDFIDISCEQLIILQDQSLTYFSGNLSAYEEDRRAHTLQMTRMKESQDRQVDHMEKTIKDSIKIGKQNGDDNRLRMAKSRQKKLDERMGMQVSASGGRFKLSRDRTGFHNSLREDIVIPKSEKSAMIAFPVAPELRFPGSLLSFEQVGFQYMNNIKPIVRDANLALHLGDRVGVVGLNGSGKSTLTKLATGDLRPSCGTIGRHSRLKVGYYSQHAVEELQEISHRSATSTALSMLLGEANGALSEQEARGILGSLGLVGRTASDVPVGKLSGGQLVRLALAKILWSPPHLLVLDEVTTHLDFYTVVALASALTTYDGALLLVTHDRYLIRCVVEGECPEGAANDEANNEGTDDKSLGRRIVYELKDGKLMAMQSGVGEFEKSLEKKLKAL